METGAAGEAERGGQVVSLVEFSAHERIPLQALLTAIDNGTFKYAVNQNGHLAVDMRAFEARFPARRRIRRK